MPKEEFDRRYPLDLVKMAYWRREPDNPEALKAVIDNIWNTDRGENHKPSDMWTHTNKLSDSRFEFYADKLMEALNKHKEPNSPDKQSFVTPLDGRIAYAFEPEKLGRLLEKLPFDNPVFTVQKGKWDMNLVVPRNEVLEWRHGRDPAEKSAQAKPDKVAKLDKSAKLNKTAVPPKAEKPSLMDALKAGEEKSRREFGGLQSGKETPEKSVQKAIKKTGEEL
jgi:hypothetical protein